MLKNTISIPTFDKNLWFLKIFRLFEMGLEKGEDPRKIYARAIELFNMKNYQDSSYLFKNCIQVSQVKYLREYPYVWLIIQNLEKGSIELLPSCLNKLAECYEAQNNVQKACIFKKFEKMYYEQVLVKKSLDMIGLLNECANPRFY